MLRRLTRAYLTMKSRTPSNLLGLSEEINLIHEIYYRFEYVQYIRDAENSIPYHQILKFLKCAFNSDQYIARTTRKMESYAHRLPESKFPLERRRTS